MRRSSTVLARSGLNPSKALPPMRCPIRCPKSQGRALSADHGKNRRDQRRETRREESAGLSVIVDEVGESDEEGSIGATARSQADAPEIDGHVFLRDVPETLQPGDIVEVTIEDADEHDLFGVIAKA
jgi:tRNA A37 methylthiotransferase MiaB